MSQKLFAVWPPVHYADRSPGVSDLIGHEQNLTQGLDVAGRIRPTA